MAAFFSEHGPNGEHQGEKSTPRVGNSDAPRRFFDAAMVADLRSRGLNDLAKLELVLAARGTLENYAALTLDELGMVEAEMIHQGILPAVNEDLRRGAGVLTFAASHEANLMTWHARRAGFSQAELSFTVDLPLFLNERTRALTAAESLNFSRFLDFVRFDSSARSQLPRPLELAYLNRFAAFLLANHPSQPNRYQRGLNVVLKTLLRPRRARSGTGKIDISLPVTREIVLGKLKAHRSVHDL